MRIWGGSTKRERRSSAYGRSRFVAVPSAAHWRDPEQRAFYLEGLRLAAGEET